MSAGTVSIAPHHYLKESDEGRRLREADPRPATPYRLEAGTNWLIRPEDQILDDTDRYGVEMGLQMASAGEGTVTLVSMGPAGNGQGIRQALAMGADDAILIEDDSLRGSDALTTARALAAAIDGRIRPGHRRHRVHRRLLRGTAPDACRDARCPCPDLCQHVEVSEGKVTIHRQTAAGYDVVEASLPAVVAVTAGVVEPRYPTFKGIMDAKKKTVENVSADLVDRNRAWAERRLDH